MLRLVFLWQGSVSVVRILALCLVFCLEGKAHTRVVSPFLVGVDHGRLGEFLLVMLLVPEMG